MKNIYAIGFTILCCFIANNACAQYEHIWAFGVGAGIDFNTGVPISISTNIGVYSNPNNELLAFGEANASICDASGSLLFYTEGYYVWDRNGNVMPNGDSLLPVQPYVGSSPTSSTSQGAIIVPMPEYEDKYYIFSLTSLEYWQQSFSNLYYSIVDMSLNGGLGDVVSGGKGILIDSFLSEHLAAVTGNYCNTWLLCKSVPEVSGDSSAVIKAYEITASGISLNPIISNVGDIGLNSTIGTIAVSPNREHIVVTQISVPGAMLFDFDATTGSISNPLPLSTFREGAYGASFSPDNTKVYIKINGNSFSEEGIYQFDLSSNDSATILSSKLKVGEAAFTQLKLAPDGKIYFIDDEEEQWLGTINFPNQTGIACGYSNKVLKCLGERIHGGLPNVVPIIKRDTFLTNQIAIAPCFTNGVHLPLQSNDTTGWDYVWNTGASGFEVIADAPGVYWVSYRTSPCIYHVDTFKVSFPNGVLPTIHTSGECRSDSNGYAYATTYPGDPVNYAYTWMQGTDTLSLTDTLSPVPSGSYSLHAQTDTGCDTLLLFEIPEEDFHVSFELSDTLICLGDTIQLHNTSDAHFTTYHWGFDNGDTSTLPNPPSYVYPASGAYRVMLAGVGEICQDTTFQTVLVDQPLVGGFEIHPENVCIGQAVSLFPKVDSTTVQLAWVLEEQLEIENTVQHRYQHAFDRAGVVPITMYAQFRACPDTSYTDSIIVYPLPEVDLGGDSSICLHGAPVYLKNLREAPLNPHHYLWSTGDTTASLKVVHPGVYTLSVTTEPIGCTTTESIEITKDCYIDVPNAFTPNGDGHNDYFFPRKLLSESISRFRMQVFNRWGQVVFETTNLDGRGWDGRLNGNAQPMGVYPYRIEAGFTNGREEQYEGDVTLVR